MTFETFIDTYGIWVGLAVYVFLKDVIPFFLNRFIPERAKAQEIQRRERVSELEAEREWQHKQEIDRLTVLHEISSATQTLATQMAQTNANITTILSGQDRMLNKMDAHDGRMMEAVGDMRAVTSTRAKRKVGGGGVVDNGEENDD